MDAYHRTLQAVQLYGPTNFSPVINHVARYVSPHSGTKPSDIGNKNVNFLSVLHFFKSTCEYLFFNVNCITEQWVVLLKVCCGMSWRLALLCVANTDGWSDHRHASHNAGHYCGIVSHWLIHWNLHFSALLTYVHLLIIWPASMFHSRLCRREWTSYWYITKYWLFLTLELTSNNWPQCITYYIC